MVLERPKSVFQNTAEPELRHDYLQLEEAAAKMDLENEPVDDQLVQSAFDVLQVRTKTNLFYPIIISLTFCLTFCFDSIVCFFVQRMVERKRQNSMETKILSKISHIFQRAIYSKTLSDTRTNEHGYIHIPNTQQSNIQSNNIQSEENHNVDTGTFIQLYDTLKIYKHISDSH